MIFIGRYARRQGPISAGLDLRNIQSTSADMLDF